MQTAETKPSQPEVVRNYLNFFSVPEKQEIPHFPPNILLLDISQADVNTCTVQITTALRGLILQNTECFL